MLALLAVVALAALGFAHGIVGFLAVDAPLAPRATTLIIEGWMTEAEFAQALAVFRQGGYVRVITTGGPIEPDYDVGQWKTYAARGAAYLRAQGVAPERIVAVPAPRTLRERTWLNGVMVREWARATATPLAAIDIATTGVHARRSRMMYRLALGDATEVGVRAVVSNEFDAAQWWRSSAGSKAVLGETLAWTWAACCFWPDAADYKRP